MYIEMSNLKITEIETKHGEHKKGKWVEYKKPIETPKVVFEDSYTNLMDVASEIKHAAQRSPQNKIIVTFEVNAEW